MRAALREYVSEVVRSWWARASFLVGGVGLVLALAEVALPSGLLWVLVVIAALIAPFRAFERVRAQRDELAREIAESEVQPEELPTFQPGLLMGRLLPSVNYAVLPGSERGLVMRAGLAFALESQPRPFDTEMQRAFEDAVAASAAEGWIHELTSSIPLVREERFWRPTQPTRGNVVTVRRPAAAILHWAYTVEGWCRLNVQTSMLPGASGHGHLVLDAVIRPSESPDPATASTDADPGGHPLAFEDLYVALHVLQVATIEQIADRVLPALLGSDEWLPSAYAVVVIANGGSVADYVALESRRWSRAEGSFDPTGGDWYAESESALRTPAERDAQIKAWLARLLRDSGYSGFEHDIDRLQPPRMPIAVPT